jgi:site-specific DNA-cytosine methylase
MPDKGNFEAVVEAKPIVIDRAAFNQGENAQYEPHIEASETMDSLVARGPHAVGVPFRKSKRAKSTTDNETWVEGEVSNTLNNFDLGDIRTTHAVVEPIAIQGTIIGRGDNAGPQGTGATEGGPMFTLTKTDIHGVAHTMPGTVAPTIGASGPPYSRTGNERVEAEALAITFQPGNLRREAGADPSTEATTTLKASAGDQMPHVAYPMAVRRLTPIECERLQGFPDNWSRIPWKGKPEEECPDGPRYKACGNSMAVPVMRWIGERILEVEQHFSNGETL